MFEIIPNIKLVLCVLYLLFQFHYYFVFQFLYEEENK